MKKRTKKKVSKTVYKTICIVISAALIAIQVIVLWRLWVNGGYGDTLLSVIIDWLPLIILVVGVFVMNYYVRIKMRILEDDDIYLYRRWAFGLWYTAYSENWDKRHGSENKDDPQK